MIINNATPISKTPSTPELQMLLSDLQGNILKSHAKPHVHLLFLQFTGSSSQIKEWLRAIPVTSMQEQLEDHRAFKAERVLEKELNFCSVSLTKKGYGRLQIDAQGLADASFQSGMGNGSISKDPPKENWEPDYQKEIHALLILAHNLPTNLDVFAASVKTSLAGVAIIIAEEAGDGLPGEKEVFGFADGVSQPRYFQEDLDEEKSIAVWNPFASLDLSLIKDPNGKAFNGGITGDGDFPVSDFSGDHSYGSYLVFRKLEQDLAGWNNGVVDLAQKLQLQPDLVGAFAVGRFKDGTPVINHSTSQTTKPIENDFDYSQDMTGSKCPFHAHIRKANPRGDTTRQFGVPLEDEKKRRITRRGIPYKNSNQEGLLFMCYQGSIETQFDFMQNSWVDNDGFLTGGVGIDDVIGQGASNPKQWPGQHGGSPSLNKFPFGKFVTMKGGEYFFTPSISFLKTLKSNIMSNITTSDWKAWIDKQPVQPTHGGTLHVTGTVDTHSGSFALLKKRPNQGINERILLLDLEVHSGVRPVENPQQIKFKEELAAGKEYDSVEIFHKGEKVGEVKEVKIVS